MAERETIDVELSARDRRLILDYGYPFPRIESAVKECPDDPTVEVVALDRIELKRLIADLYRSIKEQTADDLQMELDELCVRLEIAERGHVW